MNFQDLNKIGDRREILEQQIMSLIQDFEASGGTYVKEIRFSHTRECRSNRVTTDSINVIVDDERFDR